MSCTIYYFSATGNSLSTAKILAQQLGDCQLKTVSSCFKNSKVIEEREMVGIVCPVYYGTVPYPVRELLNKLVFTTKRPYIFLLNTYKGHCGAAAQRVDLLLQSRGQKLSFAGGVPMPGNSFLNKPGKDEESLSLQKENLALFVEQLQQNPVQSFDHSEILPLRPVDYPNNFRGILAEDSCIGCGTCTKVCPMNNISLKDGKAIIGDDCATCLACFHWCPVKAIWMSKQENIARRDQYHHPNVKLQDIIEQKHR